jgi:signal transduction histidine kinase
MHLLPLVESSEPAILLPLDDASAQSLAQVWMEPDELRRQARACQLLQEIPAILWWAFYSLQRRTLASCQSSAESAEFRQSEESFEAWLQHFPTRRQLAEFVFRDGLRTIAEYLPDTEKGNASRQPIDDQALRSLAELSRRASETGMLAHRLELAQRDTREDCEPDAPSISLPRGWSEPIFSSASHSAEPELAFWFVLGVLSWSADWFTAHDVSPDQWRPLLPSAIQQDLARFPLIQRAREQTLASDSTAIPLPCESNNAVDHDEPVKVVVQATSDRIQSWLGMLARKLLRLDQLENRFEQELRDAKLRAVKEFAYGASHEINNPLANISTRAQTLLRDESDPDRRWQLATINSQAFRAHEMISNAMLFAHPPRLVLREFDLVPVLEQIRLELLDVAVAQETRIELDLACETALLLGDEIQMGNAIKNLLQNSLDAVTHGGRVLLQLVDTGEERYTLRMQDTGPGVPEGIRPHLFDPFFSGREAGRGLGLGLSKAWTIFTLHGGAIELESSEPHATFIIHLPRTGPISGSD